MPPLYIATSTAYIAEIDVVTVYPPFVYKYPIGERSTYTTTKTVASYITIYLILVTDSALASQSTDALV